MGLTAAGNGLPSSGMGKSDLLEAMNNRSWVSWTCGGADGGLGQLMLPVLTEESADSESTV